MKKTISSILFVAASLLAFYAFTRPAADVFKVDASKSKIGWIGYNVAGGKHTGEIGVSQGSLAFDGNTLVSGSFTVDINSISVTDLTGDRATRLETHLKSEDFFDAPKFGTAVFKVTKISGTGSNLSITGDLTIKGITKPITFPATVHQSGSTVHATAKGIKIDRTQFDIKYRSGNFFSGLGDRAISDEFQLDIEIVAAK
ncbi:YceI family protein [Parapedobacter koreensis]|uniref:Polyisoprenoid-binding protein YceI n=1 Tax=Parapedobacter koreensis TaxID=332977 RepID=A0A1H7EW71_9SPHI|nr:YceI family protein [Parapedobacter koreensis]SEK18143.1 Polyisoprenoid-binding protein YceI [Parapedobacter koreensis]